MSIINYKNVLLIILNLKEDATDAEIEEAVQARGSLALHSSRPAFSGATTQADRHVAQLMGNDIKSVERYGQKCR